MIKNLTFVQVGANWRPCYMSVKDTSVNSGGGLALRRARPLSHVTDALSASLTLSCCIKEGFPEATLSGSAACHQNNHSHEASNTQKHATQALATQAHATQALL